MPRKVCNEMTYPFPKLLRRRSLGIDNELYPHFMMDAITYSGWDLSQICVSQRVFN